MFGKVAEDSFRDIFDSPLFEDRFEVSSQNGFRMSFGGDSSSNSLSGMSSNSSSPSLFPLHSSRQSISAKQCFSFNEKPFAGHDNNKLNNNSSSVSLAIGAEKKLGLQSLNANIQAAQNAQNAQNAATGPNSKVNTSRYKTEMCRPFQENGTCKYGDKCQFAHGMPELRNISRHPKYKTDLCRTYHSVGFCPYGPRCHFIHNLEELKPSSGGNGNNSGNGRSSQQGERNGSISSNSSSSGLSENGSVSPKMPPLPMFSSYEKQQLLSARTRNYSEVSSSGSLSSPSSTDPESDNSEFSASQNLAGSPTRLPVFTHLSK